MNKKLKIDPKQVKHLARLALDEDIGEDGDITTKNLLPPTHKTSAKIISKQDGIIDGLPIIREVLRPWTRIPSGGQNSATAIM